MAEDEIVIVEDDDQAQQSESSEEILEPQKEGFWSKKKIIAAAVAAGVVVALSALTALLVLSGGEKKAAKSQEHIDAKESNATGQAPRLSRSDVEKLIEKAKTMYESGDKESALKLYAQISLFNESLSNYNLGVSKMGEGDYAGALGYFDKSINSGDNELPSAINAAVCSLFLGNKEAFSGYLWRAKEALPKETASPLYSYYYTLVRYYEGRYFEALASLNAPTGEYFAKELSQIAPRLYGVFEDSDKTIAALKKSSKDSFAIGLLEARAGRYANSLASLQQAKNEGSEEISTNMALALVSLKLGMLPEAAKAFNEAMTKDSLRATVVYPISVTLREGIYASDTAQKQIAQGFFGSLPIQASQIFYFAPYKVFNPNRTISSIKKGQMGLMLDDAVMGREYLENASKSSSANSEIIRGISYALNGHVALANRSFKELAKKYNNHSVLEYNLALTHAQMGDYREAYKHFAKAYGLDAKNYEAGNLAILCGRIMGINVDRIKNFLVEDLLKANSDDNTLTNLALYSFSADTATTASQWLSTPRKGIAMNHLLASLLLSRLDRPQAAVQEAQKLFAMMPSDIVAGSFALYMENKSKDVKLFARELQRYLNENRTDMNSVYFGPDIAYKSFVEISRIAGLLPRAQTLFDAKAAAERYDRVQITKAQALTALYMLRFSDAYAHYGTLVHDLGMTNPEQLFLAGVSSIGSGHPSDAISYFELSKLIEQNNPETLFALGLLYQEAGNLNQAVTQYKQIKEKFNSNYFDFALQVRQ